MIFQVRAAGTNEELREIQTVIPIVPITNLAFGVTYEFSVRIIPKAPQSTLRRQQLPPPPLVYQRHVTKNGFIATWVSQKKADVRIIDFSLTMSVMPQLCTFVERDTVCRYAIHI